MASDDVRALAEKLLRLAEQATPGPWEWRDNQSMYAVPGPVVEGSSPPRRYPYGASVLHGTWEYDSGSWIEAADTDREYIAAASPDAVTALARAVLAQETRPTWQPIETAPKDGTWMLLVGARWVVDGPVVGAWSSDHGGYWHDCERGITGVTHWMPLPAAPHQPAPPDQPREEEA